MLLEKFETLDERSRIRSLTEPLKRGDRPKMTLVTPCGEKSNNSILKSHNKSALSNHKMSSITRHGEQMRDLDSFFRECKRTDRDSSKFDPHRSNLTVKKV